MRFRLLLLIVRLVSHGSLPTEENDKVCNNNRLIQQLIESFLFLVFMTRTTLNETRCWKSLGREDR